MRRVSGKERPICQHARITLVGGVLDEYLSSPGQCAQRGKQLVFCVRDQAVHRGRAELGEVGERLMHDLKIATLGHHPEERGGSAARCAPQDQNAASQRDLRDLISGQ